MGDKEMLNQILGKYKALINFKDQTQRGNFKFIESYIKHAKKRNTADSWIQECIWFVNQAIDLHKITLGKRNEVENNETK